MQLSLQTDFALRILMALAATRERLSVDDIARRYDISRNHLAKVAQGLQSAGYIESFRGRGGGMQLAQPAEDIIVGEVVRTFENLDGFVGCSPNGRGCVIAGQCGLQGALGGALEQFLTHLDKYRLNDLLPDRDRFAARLEQVAASNG